MKTNEDFDKKYTAVDIESVEFDSETQAGQFETYGDDYKVIHDILDGKIENLGKRNIWTVCDAEDGLVIMAGFRMVNRVFYFVTKEEWADEHEEYKWGV